MLTDLKGKQGKLHSFGHRFDAFVEFTARQHDFVVALQTLQPDIEADTGHAPLFATTGVGFAHRCDIADFDVYYHVSHYTDRSKGRAYNWVEYQEFHP